MKSRDLITLYKQDIHIQSLYKQLEEGQKHIHFKKLVGSADSLIFSALKELLHPQIHLVVLHDREEAAYFHNDIKNLLPEYEVFLFPASHKKPYQYEETDNANILLRAEVLNKVLENPTNGLVIITYPEALLDKVVNKKTLLENTLTARKGEKLDVAFISEILAGYNFEKTDFVYEAGQYAVRGGIIDVFSYANELPYRIELAGDEIESIRTFNPDNQLSVGFKELISIIPNIQRALTQEERESFFKFIPSTSLVWFKDLGDCLETIDKNFEKVSENFSLILERTGANRLIADPAALYESSKTVLNSIKKFHLVEFGKRFYFDRPDYEFVADCAPQPSFHKDFQLLVNDISEWQSRQFTIVISSESHQQLDRLETIFKEINPYLHFHPLNIGIREGFIDKQNQILCYTDHQIFERFYRYKGIEKFSKSKSITLRELSSMKPGDFVTHQDHGIGRFAGLEKVEIGGRQQEAIRLIYRDDDMLLVSIHTLHKISRYSGKDGSAPQMSKLGSQDWENKKKSVKKKIKDIAKELISLYAKRKAAPGFAFSADGYLQAALESSFLYEDTPDQAKATRDVKEDMMKPHPMDRLVCGDVGFGKTEVAIRAAFKTAVDGKQAAVLVPTTILAMQHYKTFKERLNGLPVHVEYISRFKSAKDVKETLKRVKEGKTEILIGTHRIIGKDVIFKNLGLLVIDEEQKFGVAVKEKLKSLKVNVDTLTLTATPIPRTLHFSLMGARDLSIIATPPPNRQPVSTELHVYNEEILRDAITSELKRGGQVFVVHNRILDIETIANTILKLVPDARIGIAHGQMEGSLLEKNMLKFIGGEFDVLVSTNIIESGLDIPNANTIIINRAHMFGLSDLHQMRGRVGRSNRKAFCYLLTPPVNTLPADSRKRLSALEEFSDLGDGFKVAMRDLDIRGAGNLLGGEQSGFLNDLGYEMYHKVLDEALSELKENEFKELFQTELNVKEILTDCIIETDLEILISDNYVNNISERLNLYAALDNLERYEDLEKFRENLIDRFGPLPQAVHDLTETVRLRWVAEKLGFEKITLRGGVFKGYFNVNNDAYFKSDLFGKILHYIQAHSKRYQLKDLNNKLILQSDYLNTIQETISALEDIYQAETTTA